jgi:hypothetical protein
MFKEQVITVWMIIYDGDASRIYTTTTFDKMLASIESSIRGYCGEDTPAAEEMYQQILDRVVEARDEPCIPMRFNNLTIVVYRWEIDNSNQIHHLLGRCHDIIDDGDVRERISSLFSTSVFT